MNDEFSKGTRQETFKINMQDFAAEALEKGLFSGRIKQSLEFELEIWIFMEKI